MPGLPSTYSHDLLPLPQGGCRDLLPYSQVCPRCFSSQTRVEDCCTFHLLSLTSPVPQKHAPFWNIHLLLKLQAVTRCKYLWFNLRTLANESTLLWLQYPLDFCNNHCSLHGDVCAPQASTSVSECIQSELRARNKLFCSYSIRGRGIKVKKQKTLS